MGRVGLKINHRNIYFLGIALVVVGLPLSKVLMSVGQMVLAANWLIEGNFKVKLHRFFKNKLAIAIVSLFLLHLIGLLYTTDFDYAWKDLRTKMPLFVLPLIISTSEPFNKKQFNNLLFVFISAVIISTWAAMVNFFTMDYLDIRDICVFVSHIRLGLLICLSIFILLHFITCSPDFNKTKKFLFALAIVWLVIFLVILESITGLSVLLITGLIMAAVAVMKIKKKRIRLAILICMCIIPVSIAMYIGNIYTAYFSVMHDHHTGLEQTTLLGNPYVHDTSNLEHENGHYTWLYICEKEMKEAWNKRSSISYDNKDRKEQLVKNTLIRFLTSKGYRKDAEGVNKLSDAEVKSIENGVANVVCENEHSLRTRIYETIWEYENYKTSANPNGRSMMQRFEYWKASLGIIREYPLFGVGTGDMNIAFADQYTKMNSPLDQQWRLRSHNQYLSIAVGFGIIGLLWFLFVLAFPFTLKWVRKDYYYWVFFIIIGISMLTEDTIETQAGITLFVLFNSLFLFGREHE